MRKFIFLSLLAGIAIMIFSCSRDESPLAEDESPFFSFFDLNNIQIDTTETATNQWEYGFVFSPVRNGKIDALGLKLPQTGTFTVRLWDLSGANPVLIQEELVASDTKHQPNFLSIQDVAVEKDKKYGITILASSFYRIYKKDGSNFDFPLTVKNIQIFSFNEALNPTGETLFPDATTDDHVAPCVNVVFVAD